MGSTSPGELEAVREAFELRDWERAYELLLAADAVAPLAGSDLELLGDAAYWSRRYQEMLDVLERSEAAYSRAGDTRGAARVALRLARQQHRRRNESAMMGWFARAARLLENDTECVEYGWLRWMTCAWMIQQQGQVEAGGALAREVRELGKRLGGVDLEALGLLDEGCAQIMLEQISDGFALVDEASALAMGGGLDLETTGEVYCRSIVACRNVGDWRRAAEWTESSLRWCERNAVSGFPGLCHFHRAEVMRLRGHSRRPSTMRGPRSRNSRAGRPAGQDLAGTRSGRSGAGAGISTVQARRSCARSKPASTRSRGWRCYISTEVIPRQR